MEKAREGITGDDSRRRRRRCRTTRCRRQRCRAGASDARSMKRHEERERRAHGPSEPDHHLTVADGEGVVYSPCLRGRRHYTPHRAALVRRARAHVPAVDSVRRRRIG